MKRNSSPVFSDHWSCLLVCTSKKTDLDIYFRNCGQKSKNWSGNNGWLSLCFRVGCAFGKRIDPRGDLLLKHLVFPLMLCLCRGTGALRGFTLSNLENDQPSPELCQIIPCLSKVPPQRNGASGEAAPSCLTWDWPRDCPSTGSGFTPVTQTSAGVFRHAQRPGDGFYSCLLCPPAGSDELNHFVSFWPRRE